MRSSGSVVYWNTEKGWGFSEITSAVEGTSNTVEVRDTVFIHHSDLGGKNLRVGDVITFVTAPSGHPKHKLRARDVRIVRLAESATNNTAVEAGAR